MKKRLQFVVFLVMLFLTTKASVSDINWKDRVIPLPKEMVVTDVLSLSAGNISYEIITGQEDALTLKTARKLLDQFAKGSGKKNKLVISVVDLNSRPEAVSDELIKRLKGLKNPSQAYAIVYDKSKPRKITLAANTPIGMLYAVRTLNQLVKPAMNADKETKLEIPLVNIVDWPDIEQRGEWGSYDLASVEWFSQWKLNMYKVQALSGFEKKYGNGLKGVGNITKLKAELDGLGYTIIPYISHLDHTSDRAWKGVSPPVISDKDPKSLFPGYCWSDTAINQLLEDNMRNLAEMTKGTGRDIEVWLTEQEAAICHCKVCNGANTYLQEAKAILRAYHEIKKNYPDLRLRILLSQGSWNVNKEIKELLSIPDEGITYYDGRRTYTSERKQIILPYFEDFTSKGGLVDVYPQTTPSWYAVFPGSIPQFIQYRAQEFVDKKLQAVTSYCVYDRFSFELNMTALGEYLWNANGRSPYEFSRAYAMVRGIANPELFARWAVKNGEASWTFAHFRVMQSLAFSDGFPWIDETKRGIYDKAVSDGKEALKLAIEANDRLMLLETESVLAGLKSMKLNEDIDQLLTVYDIHKKLELEEKLKMMNFYAQLIRTNLYEWDRITMEKKREELTKTPPEWLAKSWSAYAGPDFMGERGLIRERIMLPANALLRLSEEIWERADSLGVEDKRGDMKPVEIAKWIPADFNNGSVTLNPDISAIVPKRGGKYNLEFYLRDRTNTNIREISIVITNSNSGEERVIYQLKPEADAKRIKNVEISMPGRNPRIAASEYDRGKPSDEKVSLRLVLADNNGSKGIIKLRKVWSYDNFPWDKQTILLEE